MANTGVQSATGEVAAAAKPPKKSHIYGWIALIAFLLANVTPAILAPLIILVGFVFALLEMSKGSGVFGIVVLSLCALQTWFIADHFGNISGAVGLTTPKEIEEQAAAKLAGLSLETPGDANQTISQKCSEEWPSDFRMQDHCQGRQREGVEKLDAGRPGGISENAFAVIRNKCANEWPRDFAMRAHCESKQYDGYRSLEASAIDESKRGQCAQKWPDDYNMRSFCERR